MPSDDKDEECFAFIDGKEYKFNFEALPNELIYEHRAMAIRLDFNDKKQELIFYINGVNFNLLYEAPALREPLARSKTSINMHGIKK